MAFLHDTGVGRGLDVARLGSAQSDGSRDELDARSWIEGKPAIALFAHGDATPARTLTMAEVAADARRFAQTLELEAGQGVASTLTPTEPTALFAALLAPLITHSRFRARRLLVEEIDEEARAGGFDVLVLAEAHHRRLRECGKTGAFDSLRTHVVTPVPTSPESATVEAALLACVGVRDVAVRDVDGPNGRRLLAAIVSDPAHSVPLRCAAQAATHLAVDIRMVRELERDENGYLTAAEHHLVLGLGRDGQPVAHGLEWRVPTRICDELLGRREWAFAVRVPERYAHYEGHFPTYPVLAGAVQLQRLVIPCLGRTRARERAVEAWLNLKFVARIEPGDELEVVVVLDEGDPVRGGAFEIRREETRCSLGRFRFTDVS